MKLKDLMRILSYTSFSSASSLLSSFVSFASSFFLEKKKKRENKGTLGDNFVKFLHQRVNKDQCN